MSWWELIVSAGVALAKDYGESERIDDAQNANKEIEILKLQNRERDRANQKQISEMANATTLQSTELSLQGQKKRILGDVLLQQGKGQEALGIEAYRASANRPERFNTAASVLAKIFAQ
jgi:hypothetical protein